MSLYEKIQKQPELERRYYVQVLDFSGLFRKTGYEFKIKNNLGNSLGLTHQKTSVELPLLEAIEVFNKTEPKPCEVVLISLDEEGMYPLSTEGVCIWKECMPPEPNDSTTFPDIITLSIKFGDKKEAILTAQKQSKWPVVFPFTDQPIGQGEKPLIRRINRYLEGKL